MTTLPWEQRIEHVMLELAKSSHELRQKMTEMAEQVKRNEEKTIQNEESMTRTRKEMGEVSKRLGRIVEDIIAPDLPDMLRMLVDCPANEEIAVNTNVQRLHPGKPTSGQRQKVEIDAMAACGNYVLINETKSTLRTEHIQRLQELLTVARDYFPEYQHYQFIGCVASLHVGDDLIRYANRQGLVVLAMKEGLIKIVNRDDFSIRYF
ncbi:hypothetical protein QUF64_03550 [Anaerolineales bacterium HSG6]|nr:hypothetical protein [Anaerolineales bacterium HSG6]MDM8531110.1 hypothetical protein [Anaerolineales bacterium HSG25]